MNKVETKIPLPRIGIGTVVKSDYHGGSIAIYTCVRGYISLVCLSTGAIIGEEINVDSRLRPFRFHDESVMQHAALNNYVALPPGTMLYMSVNE